MARIGIGLKTGYRNKKNAKDSRPFLAGRKKEEVKMKSERMERGVLENLGGL